MKYFCGEGAQRTEAQARTRRNPVRDEGGGNRRGRNASTRDGYGKTGSDKKKIMKESVATKKTKTMTKKDFKVKGDADYDSESDLSAADNVPAITKRSSRSAAIQAKKRVSASAKSERKNKKYIDSTDDEDDEDYDNEGDDTVEEEEVDDDEVEDGESSSEDEAVRRAKERQAKALERARGKGKKFEKKAQKKKFSKDGETKGNKVSKKNASKKNASKKTNTTKKTKKGKKPVDKDSDSEFDSDSDDDDLSIDMDELIAEAMAGAQMSVLHSFCWWRVVLGTIFPRTTNIEASFISA